MSKLPPLRHPLKSNDLRKIIEAHGFVRQDRHGIGSSHIIYRNGSYTFTFTNKGNGKESSPAQIKEFKKLLMKMQKSR